MSGASTPKPRGQRRRRNRPTPGDEWRSLSAEAHEGGVPAAPDEWGERTVDRWAAWWRAPMALVWLEADAVSTLERYGWLWHEVDSGVSKMSAVAREMGVLEDRLGLSPLARRRLHWEVKQAVEAGAGSESDRVRAREVLAEDGDADDERFE